MPRYRITSMVNERSATTYDFDAADDDATTSIAKQRYCWLVWKHGRQGPTEFRWLTTKSAGPRHFPAQTRYDSRSL